MNPYKSPAVTEDQQLGMYSTEKWVSVEKWVVRVLLFSGSGMSSFGWIYLLVEHLPPYVLIVIFCGLCMNVVSCAYEVLFRGGSYEVDLDQPAGFADDCPGDSFDG